MFSLLFTLSEGSNKLSAHGLKLSSHRMVYLNSSAMLWTQLKLVFFETWMVLGISVDDSYYDRGLIGLLLTCTPCSRGGTRLLWDIIEVCCLVFLNAVPSLVCMTLLVCRVGGGLTSVTAVAVQMLLVCTTPWIYCLDSCINRHSFTACFYFFLFFIFWFV